MFCFFIVGCKAVDASNYDSVFSLEFVVNGDKSAVYFICFVLVFANARFFGDYCYTSTLCVFRVY